MGLAYLRTVAWAKIAADNSRDCLGLAPDAIVIVEPALTGTGRNQELAVHRKSS